MTEQTPIALPISFPRTRAGICRWTLRRRQTALAKTVSSSARVCTTARLTRMRWCP